MKTTLISERAVLMRINRRLPPHQQLRILKGRLGESRTGRYFISDRDRSVIVQTHVSLEEMARKLRSLQDWERIA